MSAMNPCLDTHRKLGLHGRTPKCPRVPSEGTSLVFAPLETLSAALPAAERLKTLASTVFVVAANVLEPFAASFACRTSGLTGEE